ncbi:CocE/NonD family hydrolase [Amycolatopsis jejuensis]|uniref:CocE/NonD family hydrolase n=1 Tax=Amycolatopsis jejuensis TaxID=330084 RepID=UPI00052684AF|nr:CocE/NonD family hydrolase [Amycolatopsis jejuensis]
MKFSVDTEFRVPMRDGVELATSVWRPDGPGPFPALLVRTPYGKDGADLYGNQKLPDVFALVEAGYAVVAQDVRGTGQSPELLEPHRHDGEDGVDTLGWLAAQPWCDGNIGTWGGSYMGFVQWQAAALGAPALRAMSTAMTSADLYRAPWYSPGGALSLGGFYTWASLAALGNVRRGAAPGRAGELMAGLADSEKLFDPLPVADRSALIEALPWVREVLDHPERDAYWENLAAIDRAASITVPAFHLGGWYDLFLGETVRAYTLMRQHGGSEAAREGQRLVIGPWGHPDGADAGLFPDRSFGMAGSIKAAAVTDSQLQFFDHWIRGRADDGPRVRIFVMGIDTWRDETDWPLPDTRYTDYHLTGDGRANTARGDGRLTAAGPDQDASDVFRYDPLDPVPTLGGNILPLGGFAGPADQSEIENRSDVLCYTTPELDRPLEVTGPVELVLHVSSSAPDTDFTGKLVDVHPDGRALILCEGMCRTRYQADRMVPGDVYELRLDLNVTSNVFLPGHRLRLEVSSSNFPRYDRNTNTGGVIAEEARTVVAINQVHHGPAHPSRLVLPIIERS